MSFYIDVPVQSDPAGSSPSARANIVAIHDAHPGLTPMFFRLYRELMYQPGPLPRWQREMVAAVVSSVNGCHY